MGFDNNSGESVLSCGVAVFRGDLFFLLPYFEREEKVHFLKVCLDFPKKESKKSYEKLKSSSVTQAGSYYVSRRQLLHG